MITVSSDDEDAVLQLSRFAYKPAHSTSSRQPDPGPSRPCATLAKKDPQDNFRVAQLCKCVGCGLEWTSKKTVNQKRAHINRCARKHSLTKDIVKLLVEKEITLQVSGSAQNTSSSPVRSSETTLLSSVIPVAPPKKSRRQQVLSTVKSLPETRDGILSKARDILGHTTTQEDDSEPAQHFSGSALARTSDDGSKHDILSSHVSINGLPSTQPFGVGALRNGTIIMADGLEHPRLQLGASLFAQNDLF